MPTLQQLDEAMLRASTSLPILGRLGGGQIALVEGRQPWRAVGLDNAVYVLRQPTGRVLALRVPLADGDHWGSQERYRALGADPRLAGLRDAPGSPLAPRVAWYADGLLLPARDLRSTPHPVAVLDWIEGPTLIAAVDRACRAGDGRALAALAEAWLRATAMTTGAGFVHGDLAGDNVVVRPDGSLRFVDFDESSWPGVPAAPARRVNPAYAHPGGAPPPAARGDDFAVLTVYVSLRALAERPDLRSRFGDPTSEPGGALLWRGGDLAKPDASPVFAALGGVSPALVGLVRLLRQVCAGPVDRTPRLGDVVAGLRGGQDAAGPADVAPWDLSGGALAGREPSGSAMGWGGAGQGATVSPVPPQPPARSHPPRSPQPTAAVQPVQPAQSTRSWQSPPMAPHDPRVPLQTQPRPVAPPSARAASAGQRTEMARGRQALVTRLNGLLMSGEIEATLAFWESSGASRDPEILRDYGPRMRDVERLGAVGRVRAAAAAHDAGAVLRLWREYGLGGLPAARELGPAVEEATRREAQAERLRVALDAGDRGTVAALWAEVRGDPLVAMYGARVATLLERTLGERVTAAIQRGDDRAILAALADAESAAVPVAAEARAAGRAAANREATRKLLATARRDGDEAAMATLASLAISGRLGDLGRLDAETARAAQRAVHRPALLQALAGDDDWAIAAAYQAHGTLYDELGLEPGERARIDLARARLAWLTEVRAALRGRDLGALKAVTRSSPPGAVARLSEIERTRIERLSRRDVAVRRLERLLKTGDDREILAALASMKETGAAFPPGFDWAALRAVEERTELADGIRAALDALPPDLERLASLLPAAKAAAEAGNSPIIPGTTLEQVERDVLRAAQIARVQEAIGSGDDELIAAVAMPDPGGIMAALSAAEQERVWRAVAVARSKV